MSALEPGVEPEAAPRSDDIAGVAFRPPPLYLGSLLLGGLLQVLAPWSWLPAPLAGLWPLGPLLVAGGIGLMAWAMRHFARAHTPVPTNEPTRALVRTGPYARSRNPIYVGFNLIHFGVALWADSAWLLCTQAGALVALRYGVIAREERYLERRYGDAYRAYCASVRRWL